MKTITIAILGLVIFVFVVGARATPLVAQECDKAFTEIVAEAEVSVVQVFSVQIDPFSSSDQVNYKTGSGVIFDNAGHVITNAHLVHSANEVAVVAADGQLVKADLVGSDPISDIAVIRLVAPAGQFKAMSLEGSHPIGVGQEVVAIGFPFGIGKSASRGIISAVGVVVPRTTLSWQTPLIQTDAAINPGNSGGPLISRCGEVVGINSAVLMRGQGLGFAIPRDAARQLAEQIIAEGRVIRPWHGVNGTMVPPPLQHFLGLPNGLLVETVEPGSPAEEVGLRGGNLPVRIGMQEFVLGGDIIVSINGSSLRTIGDVLLLARSLNAGDEVTIEYWSGGVVKTATALLPERPVLEGDLRYLRMP